jgi:hypothetical protein
MPAEIMAEITEDEGVAARPGICSRRSPHTLSHMNAAPRRPSQARARDDAVGHHGARDCGGAQCARHQDGARRLVASLAVARCLNGNCRHLYVKRKAFALREHEPLRSPHPTMPEREAQQTVALMISAVARDHPAWLWRGVGAAR